MAQSRKAQKISVKFPYHIKKKTFSGLGTVTRSQTDTHTAGLT
jgi:hypothetical protein